MKKQEIEIQELKSELQKLESTLLTHHMLIWLLTGLPHFQSGFGWPLIRGIQDSNSKLLADYEHFCQSLFGCGLTDGHTTVQIQ